MNKNKSSSIHKCPECQAIMYKEKQVIDEKMSDLLDDTYTSYICESCGNKIEVMTIRSIGINMFSALFVGGLTIYFLFTGLFDFIIYSLTYGFWEAILGIFLMLISLLFLFGSIFMLYTSFREEVQYVYRKQSKNEELTTKQKLQKKKYIKGNLTRIGLALLLALLPLLIVIGIGHIDFYIVKLSEDIALILLPKIFTPLFFADKLKSSGSDVFLGMIFWLLIAFGLYLILD